MCKRILCLIKIYLICSLLIINFGCARTEENNQVQKHVPNITYSNFNYSKQDLEEIYIGSEIHREITAQFSTYKNEEIEKYVNEIGNNLISYANRKVLPYRFTILYDERMYATAAPGGFIYITTGLINFLDNEAELAGVLAHEIGSIQYSDPRISNKKKVLENITQTGTAVAPMFGSYGTMAAIGLQMLNAYMFNERSPEDRVFDADKLTLEYLLNASYDPQGFIDFLYKIIYTDSDERKLLFHYLVSHPISMDRMNAINENFKNLDLEGKNFDVGRDRFLQITKPIRNIYLEH